MFLNSKPSNKLNPPCVSLSPLQIVLWATSSPSPALFPARCVLPTAEPARRDRLCVNVAVAFIGQQMMPTLLPAQVSFVGLFVYAWLSGRCLRGLIFHLSFTLTVGTQIYNQLPKSTLYYNLKTLLVSQAKKTAKYLAALLNLHIFCHCKKLLFYRVLSFTLNGLDVFSSM